MASKTLDECNAAGGFELQPEQGIDSIVSILWRKLDSIFSASKLDTEELEER